MSDAFLLTCVLSRLQYETTKVKVDGEGYSEQYEVHYASITDWLSALVTDPYLKDFFVWDAQRLYIYDGHKFERFVDEPYTANRFWIIQVRIMLCFLPQTIDECKGYHTGRVNTIRPHHIRRQVKAFVVRNAEGLSRYGALCELDH